ncbi:hypothetical protein AAHA92_01159 [Salvia divinorum]|uniref:Uncharacterized protein n=1 Tax=Salvia divinorum TaxID=28513 RepID=A0ABD1ILY9_SALDI
MVVKSNHQARSNFKDGKETSSQVQLCDPLTLELRALTTFDSDSQFRVRELGFAICDLGLDSRFKVGFQIQGSIPVSSSPGSSSGFHCSWSPRRIAIDDGNFFRWIDSDLSPSLFLCSGWVTRSSDCDKFFMLL